MVISARMMMRADRHVRRVRLIALLHRVLVQRGVVVPLQVARAGEPLVARGAVVRLWPSRLIALPRLVRQRRLFWRLLKKTAGHLMTRYRRLRARYDRRTRMSRRLDRHMLTSHELTLIW